MLGLTKYYLDPIQGKLFCSQLFIKVFVCTFFWWKSLKVKLVFLSENFTILYVRVNIFGDIKIWKKNFVLQKFSLQYKMFFLPESFAKIYFVCQIFRPNKKLLCPPKIIIRMFENFHQNKIIFCASNISDKKMILKIWVKKLWTKIFIKNFHFTKNYFVHTKVSPQ